MVFKLIDAGNIKVGMNIIINGTACTVRNIDISKTGKHGASKARIEAIGITDNKKRVIAVPGHERFEMPMIEKRRGQILSIPSEEKASVMDIENFETLEILVPEELRDQLKESIQVEYWIVDGAKIIKRVI